MLIMLDWLEAEGNAGAWNWWIYRRKRKGIYDHTAIIQLCFWAPSCLITTPTISNISGNLTPLQRSIISIPAGLDQYQNSIGVGRLKCVYTKFLGTRVDGQKWKRKGKKKRRFWSSLWKTTGDFRKEKFVLIKNAEGSWCHNFAMLNSSNIESTHWC